MGFDLAATGMEDSGAEGRVEEKRASSGTGEEKRRPAVSGGEDSETRCSFCGEEDDGVMHVCPPHPMDYNDTNYCGGY